MIYRVVELPISSSSQQTENRNPPLVEFKRENTLFYEVQEDPSLISYLKTQLRAFFEDKGKFETLSLANFSLTLKLAVKSKKEANDTLLKHVRF